MVRQNQKQAEQPSVNQDKGRKFDEAHSLVFGNNTILVYFSIVFVFLL